MKTAARHSAFHPLRVAEVDRITDDAVALTFDVPPELREAYRFTPGQHVTLRRFVGDEEIRRTYSVCDPAPGRGGDGWPEGSGPSRLRVGVRLVEGGAFSTYALKEVAAEQELEVMTPAGRFGLGAPTVPSGASGHFAAIVGGSGITPVLSIAATVLAERPETRFCLIRSDRTAASTMFLEEVADLKDRYPGRFQLVRVLSREEQQAGLPSGRLDRERLTGMLPVLLPVDRIGAWFLCGPYGLVGDAEHALRGLGVERARIHQEIFHVAEETGRAAPSASATTGGMVSVTLNGRGGSWPWRDGETVLETVLRNRADAPYACKGGVCGTCRTQLVSGEVRMDRNFALEPEELAAGYVLACQSHPATETVEVDFDA